MVHPQNALPEPLVVCSRSINLTVFAHTADIILSQLILFNGNITVGTEYQDLMDEVVRVGFFRLTLARIIDCVLG